jgi:flavin reductase (DIM6/NTAB) family NADH-FMN oxidoreductase RutF
MFYETDGNQHGLPHDPFKSCIVPRPIGWITTLSRAGIINLAPYSFFNGVASEPPMVMFAANGPPARPDKDTLKNCEETGEFVANMATWALREQMNRSSAPVAAEVEETALAGLDTEPAVLVKPPRVKAAPIHLECAVHQVVDLPCTALGGRNAMVLGRVLGIHIRDEVLRDGLVDLAGIKPIARLGYMDYTVIQTIFPMTRPSL